MSSSEGVNESIREEKDCCIRRRRAVLTQPPLTAPSWPCVASHVPLEVGVVRLLLLLWCLRAPCRYAGEFVNALGKVVVVHNSTNGRVGCGCCIGLDEPHVITIDA